MVDDYSKASADVVKVKFPLAREMGDGRRLQEWEVKTDGAVAAISTDELARLGGAMSRPDFEVELVRRAEDLFVLRVVMLEDARQGRFLFDAYAMLRYFDEHCARILSIEGLPRSSWTPFREWPTPA
ncbi:MULTISPECIES: hypothetical protein [Corallococcus]|uniref:hypothetical protein n=1 Tax=Corallococcus TaxID=83461 RepID=UPI001180F9DD|nr:MULTISPECIES: hypothetical protein [Corallococcus]NBD07715.1 hypothetical protein [Corallococcus silvisoli]TSC33711.1 hypothetical protein FOF48_01260 [Corallococcus sp. Z5C101001]